LLESAEVPRGTDRDVAGPALVLAGAGVVTGAAIGAALARRRRSSRAPAKDAELVARSLLEEPWRDVRVLDTLVSPEYVGHDPAESEPVRGPGGVRASIERYLAAFPDAVLSVEEQVSEGERVASRWTARGTHTGEIAGIAGTGRQATVAGMTIFRIEGGRAVEGWTSWDRLGLLVQLGAVSEPAHASEAPMQD
jgi:predicted ester cyclase